MLSGGEQQMLALARALSRNPSLLLADELSLGLAPKIVDRLLGAVRAAADERGTGALIVEQHAHKALKYADRMYLMARGQILLRAARGRGDRTRSTRSRTPTCAARRRPRKTTSSASAGRTSARRGGASGSASTNWNDSPGRSCPPGGQRMMTTTSTPSSQRRDCVPGLSDARR